MRYSFWTTLIALVMSNQQIVTAAEQPLIFSTAPTHSLQKTREIYTPIINYISKKTGKKIVLEYPINFVDYTNKLKKDHYDFVFDGPHFVGWRMAKYNHAPIVKLPGKIKIVVATKKDSDISNYKDLAGRRVCTFPSPNMLTMSFLEYFPNPAQQPVPVHAKGFKGLENCLQNKPGISAGVLRDKMWNKIKGKDNLKILFTPQRSYPERTLSASNRVDVYTQTEIQKALLSEEAKPYLQKLLKTFKRKNLVAAKSDEYEGLGLLLKDLWGFELTSNTEYKF